MDKKQEANMHSPPRIGKREQLRFTLPVRRETIIDALLQIQGRWFFEEMGSHILKTDKETPQVKWEFIDSYVLQITLYLHKNKRYGWFYLKKKTIHRKVLRITDFVNGGEGRLLKYELFVDSPFLRNHAYSILTYTAKQLGYSGVQFTDMSKDRSAWYPEDPPKARLLK